MLAKHIRGRKRLELMSNICEGTSYEKGKEASLDRGLWRVWVGTCEASRFDSNSNRPFWFDSKVMDRFKNFWISK